MKIFGFVKKVFFIGLTILSDFTNIAVFQWIIKHVKQDLKLLMLTVIILYFILLVLKQVNVVRLVIILMIHTQKCVPDVVKDLNIEVFNLM